MALQDMFAPPVRRNIAEEIQLAFSNKVAAGAGGGAAKPQVLYSLNPNPVDPWASYNVGSRIRAEMLRDLQRMQAINPNARLEGWVVGK